MAHRTPDLFARTARQAGKVEAVTKKAIIVLNDDGTKTGYEIGRRYGKWSGEVVPHELKTTLKAGDRVNVGDVIIYNSNYFTPDTMDPKQAIYKAGVLARTVFVESADTLEDSSAVTRAFAEKLVTRTTNIRHIPVNFTEEIRNMLEIGETVTADSILCTIYEPMAGAMDVFEGEALDTLADIGSMNPKAEHRGTIERIEVLYAGEFDQMSDSLRALADHSDSELYRLCKALKKPVVNGHVEVGFRINNSPIPENSAVLKVYITSDVSVSSGDKGVFGNQMKSIFGRILEGENTTEDGVPFDAFFGYDANLRRVVNSCEFIGTLGTCCIELGKFALAAYDGED